MPFSSEFYEFIHTHRDADTDALLLKYAQKQLPFHIQDAITQIVSRKKAAEKIPELIARGLLFPSTLLAEQCSSQLMADLHTTLITPDASVADLTFGLGVDSFTMARKASAIHAVDTDAKTVEYGKMNANTLQAHNVTVNHSSAQEWAATIHPEIDTIFIDPARRKQSSLRAFRLEDCSPNLCNLLPLPGFHNKSLIVKASPMLDINYALHSLPNVSQLIIAAVKGECKEMIIVCHTTNTPPHEPTITATHISPTGTSSITINASERALPAARLVASSSQITPGQYLYEPNAAVMKTTPWHHLETLFPSLIKFSPHAHLFISNEYLEEFPGKRRRITRIYHSAKQAARELKATKANIATRAYPLTPQQLRKKLRMLPCPDQSQFLIGTSAASENLLILAETI